MLLVIRSDLNKDFIYRVQLFNENKKLRGHFNIKKYKKSRKKKREK